jgi:death-on-curing protein
MESVIFLSVDDVLLIHQRIIEEFGGDGGLRDRGLLESAVAMPRSTFDGEELHSGLAEKAAAYHFHLCSNHPFVDGSKRVALAAAELFLLINRHELSAGDDDTEELTLGVAEGGFPKTQVTEFFVNHLMPSTTYSLPGHTGAVTALLNRCQEPISVHLTSLLPVTI